MTSRPPELPPDTDPVAWLRALPPDRRARALDMLGQDEAEALDAAWRAWAHEGQRPPDEEGDWRTWVIMAGRGFGKTRAGAQWVLEAVKHSVTRGVGRSLVPTAAHAARPLRIALVAATLDEARRIMIEGESGLLAVADAWIARWEPTRRILSFAGGAEAHLFSGASPEQLRGPQHHLAWCDELAKWEKPGDTWDMLQLGLRLGERPRALVTTTPRAGPDLGRIMKSPATIVTGGPTRANPHLAASWKQAMHDLYAGTRLAEQELEGKLLTDAPGALWWPELLERCRLKSPSLSGEGLGWGMSEAGADEQAPPPSPPLQGRGEMIRPTFTRPAFTRPAFTRIVIGVDPPTRDGTCGIVACAKDAAGRAHVLADHSVTGRSPEGWSRAVADAVRLYSSPAFAGEGDHPQGGGGVAEGEWGERLLRPLVVAEQNQGGHMVASVLHTADPDLRVKLVTATAGKVERAAPVAMLFEAGKVLLHGRFPELEAQLCGMIAGGDYDGPGKSPDRADAMVWGLTELMLKKERALPRIRQL